MSTNTPASNNDNSKFLRAVEEAFFLLDKDQNRSVTSEDFCAVAKSVGIELDSNEALLLMQTAIGEQTDDHQHETKLTVDEYATLMLRYVGSSDLDDELRQTFNTLDRDRDGRITPDDLDKLRHESSFFDHLDDEQYDLVVKELLIQANHNHGIDFTQFVNLMMHQ